MFTKTLFVVSAAIAALLSCTSALPSGTFDARAHYHAYQDWYDRGYAVDSLFCTDKLSSMPKNQLAAHPYVAFCGAPGMSQQLCGTCLNLQNTESGKSIVVRIVDQCAHGGGLDIAENAFAALDTADRKGYQRGNMPLKYSFVNC